MKKIISLFTVFLMTNAYAFFCPKNFQQINMGDSIEKVKMICGAPDEEKKSQLKPNQPQEWTYFIPQTVTLTMGENVSGTVKASVAFDKDGHAVNITVNGIAVGSSNICGGSIALGDDQKSVQQNCGNPSITTTSNTTINNTPPQTIAITQFFYHTNPPQILTFHNGILQNIER